VCPLCDRTSQSLDRFLFAPKRDLPDAVEFEICEDCNFIFAADVRASSYQRYYASVRNDADHVVTSDDADSDVQLQTSHLLDVLPPAFDGRILDFGCGQGRLLRSLAHRFPAATLYGHDVADHLSAGSDIRFLPGIDGISERFDLILLSHVAEHLVNFQILHALEGLLEVGGLMYIEVPSPAQYIACPRREFMYYFDRLHINHFSARALQRLLAGIGLDVVHTGTHRFRYRDGHYPALYCVAARPTDRGHVDDVAKVAVDDVEEALGSVYRAYVEDQRQRASSFRRRLETSGGGAGILVYGAGDNFRRSRGPGGPLDGVALLAVMDQRANEMSPEEGLCFALPAVAMGLHPDAPVVITVSQRSEEIASWIRGISPHRTILFA
jgi:2-polyprenyl-3-methyl-5-hydroxy-6-metoxy-1,4-benzoquinol methylase